MSDDTIYLEGVKVGGSALHALLALSSLYLRPFRLSGFGSSMGEGLRASHLATIEAMRLIVDAQVEGAHLGSREVLFVPRDHPRGGVLEIDLEPNAPMSQICRIAIVPLSAASRPSTVIFRGGTHLPTSPAAEYLETVYLPCLRKAGLLAAVHCPRGGYGASKGEIHLHIAPSVINEIDMERRGELQVLDLMLSYSQWSPDDVRDLVAAVSKEFGSYPHRLHLRDRPSEESGAYLHVLAECDQGRAGFGVRHDRRTPASLMATIAGKQFRRWLASDASVDDYLSDQLILPAACSMGGGRWSSMEVTPQTLSVAQAVEQFTGRAVPVSPEGVVGVSPEWEGLLAS